MIPNDAPPAALGRYELSGEIARGGMASVHLGRLRGAVGFARVVAIKRMHPFLAKEPAFVAMFVDEARTAARIHHANVIPTLDVVSEKDELCLVMEYVNGDALSSLLRLARASGQHIPIDIALAVAAGTLHGLHAAHEATNERGEPLSVVHRDVSPHNILVGVDGITRVFDFGVAKATGRLQTTTDGAVKGKCAYMAPEQLRDEPLDRRADVYALGVVLWEMLAGVSLFGADSPAASVAKAMTLEVPAPRTLRTEVPHDVDALVMRALQRPVERRFESAREMALAIEAASIAPASPTRVSQWMQAYAKQRIDARNAAVAALEDASSVRPARKLVTAGQSFVPTATAIPVDAGASSIVASRSPPDSPPAEIVAPVPAPARSRARWFIGALLIIGLGGAFFLRAARKLHQEAEPTAASSSIASVGPAASVVVNAPPATEDSPPPAPSPSPSSSPSTAPPPVVRATNAPRRAAAPAHAPRTSRSAAPAGNDDAYGLSH